MQRQRHFADADEQMAEWAAIFTSTVMAIGTDMSLKCSWGFFETARGNASHSVAQLRMLAQLMGRPGRDKEHPLDGVVLGEMPSEDEYPGWSAVALRGKRWLLPTSRAWTEGGGQPISNLLTGPCGNR